jgi:hypothetical protein
MGDNPPPRDYAVEQVVRGESGLRVRQADERTASSGQQSHERFIIATPIGVSDSPLRGLF